MGCMFFGWATVQLSHDLYDCVDEDAGDGVDMMSRLRSGIDSLLVNSGSKTRSSISFMLLSWDKWT